MGLNQGKENPYKLISDAEMAQLIGEMPSDMMKGIKRLEERIRDPKLSRDELEAIQAQCYDYVKKSRIYHKKLSEHLARMESSGEHVRELGMADKYLDRLERTAQDQTLVFKTKFPLPKGFVWEAPELKDHYAPLPERKPAVAPEPVVDQTLDDLFASEMPSETNHVVSEMPEIVESPHSQTLDAVVDDQTDVTDYVSEPLPEVSESTQEELVDEDVVPEDALDMDGLDLQVDDFEKEQEDEMVLHDELMAPFNELAQKEANKTRLNQRQDRIQDYIEKDQSAGSTISVQEGFEDVSEEDER